MGIRRKLVEQLAEAGAFDVALRARSLAPPSTITAFTFHRVADPAPDDPFDPDVVDATTAQFRRAIEVLARSGTPITITQLLASLDGAPLPPNPLLVTFDDAYRSCIDTALPILRAAGVPATFFVPTAFPDGDSLFWWERISVLLATAPGSLGLLDYPRPMLVDPRSPGARKELCAIVKNTPGLDLERFLAELGRALRVEWTREIERSLARLLVMSWDDVRALARAGMDVESHTRSHRVLETLDRATLRDELVESRSTLETQLGRPVRALAYPVGRTPPAYIRRAVADAGYRIAFTNEGGVNRVWPRPLSSVFSVDSYVLRRQRTDRDSSAAMVLAQLALPAVAY